MKRWPLWPRSLPGQMALLVAIALFVAQAVNFTLILFDRQQARIEAGAAPMAGRLLDAMERLDSGRPLPPRGRVRLEAQDTLPPGLPREHGIESAMAKMLRESGVAPAQVIAAVRPIPPDDPRFRDMAGFRVERLRRLGGELLVAADFPDRGWLVTSQAWPMRAQPFAWRLIAQTLILYGAVLVPILWITRRMSRPLRKLTIAARGFAPGDEAPLEEEGPEDVRALIAAFAALRLRVTAMLDEKDRMLGAIGHDLRTPLAALRVRLEAVEDEAEAARSAEIIDEMSRTLDDILSLARLGRPSEPPTEVDVAALVEAVVEDFRDLGREIGFAEPTRIRMRLRPTLMRRAVRNLIENALKYARDISVELHERPASVEIAVCDRGPGIPPDRLGDVFDPFTRLETSRNRDTGGAGLGLALARAIVRDAGGDILLANRAGGGLIATIRLPRQAVAR